MERSYLGLILTFFGGLAGSGELDGPARESEVVVDPVGVISGGGTAMGDV